jgi:hypothetical protein
MRVAGQGAVEYNVDQMDERVTADGDDRAFPGIERDVSYTLQAQGQRQYAGADQPQDDSRRFQPAQQRAGQDRRQRIQVSRYRGHSQARLKAHRLAMIAQPAP